MKQATIHTLFTGSTLYSLEFSSTITTNYLATNQGNDTKDPLPGRFQGKILAYPVRRALAYLQTRQIILVKEIEKTSPESTYWAILERSACSLKNDTNRD